MNKAFSVSVVAGLALHSLSGYSLALSQDTRLELGCSAGEWRGATLINPANFPLEGTYEDTCQLALGGTLLAVSDSWELQVSGWAEQRYSEDATGKSHQDLDWYWQDSHLRWSRGRLQVSLGASNVEQGPGYAWNPLNPFFDIRLNERDSAIPYRREADPMASASWSDDQGLWRFMAIDHKAFPLDYPEKGRDRYSYLLSREQLFTSSQLTLNLASLEGKPFLGLSYEWTASDALELHAELSWREGRKIPGFTATEAFPGAWLASYQTARDNTHYMNGLLGMQYSFSNNINLIVEYYYQEDGYGESEWNQLADQLIQQHAQWQANLLPDAALGLLLGSHQWLRLLHRDYAFARLAFPDVWGDAEVTLFGRHNLVDSSLIAGTSLSKPLGDRLTLKLSYQYAEGAAISEGHWIPRDQELAAAMHYHF